MNVVILAAGQGKRMHSALPKVLHPVAGSPMLARVIATARALAPTRIIVVYGHGGEQVRAALPDADLHWVEQNPPKGTGHAVQQAVPLLDPSVPTLVLYGDVPLTRVETLQALRQAADATLGVLTVDLPEPRGYGRMVREAGRVVRIVEERDATAAERAITEVNTGILVAPTVRLIDWLSRLRNDNAQGEYYLTDIIAMAVAEGLVVATAQPAHAWEAEGVNSKTQLAQLERIAQRVIADRLLEQGVTLADPGRLDVRGELVCGRDVSIDINCLFEGKVSLGEGVVVGAHCVLRNVSVGAGTCIEPFSHLDGATVGEAARIGPYARLRPGAQLARDVHIGNFVEVKAADIGEGSKANHLAYVGDATVGARVNIGAGTITCNYDGVNKHRTVIEDDAFIGSDTQLVAPVRVGRGATLGAGTTLTRDAPPDQLTVSRAKQLTVPGWKRPVKTPKKA
jgi:bifunctional UDP-N-acetylglucosamine pyrophosphorylase/glucosamine-1-phosphate N-acetyltransferase